MTEIVAADIGGTHARFAIAEVQAGRVVRLDEEVTLKTAEYASLQTASAWPLARSPATLRSLKAPMRW
jgi:glucokinase